jgi:hypothetical protein
VFKPLLKDEKRGGVIATLKSPILTYSALQKTSCSLIFDWNTGDFESGILKVILYPNEMPSHQIQINTIKGNNLKTYVCFQISFFTHLSICNFFQLIKH